MGRGESEVLVIFLKFLAEGKRPAKEGERDWRCIYIFRWGVTGKTIRKDQPECKKGEKAETTCHACALREASRSLKG